MLIKELERKMGNGETIEMPTYDDLWKYARQLEKDKDDMQDILAGIEEINPSNYDHELVCKMNAGVNELSEFFDWPES